MAAFLAMVPAGPGEIGRPDPERLIAGDPVFETWNLEDRDGLFAGIWRATPGKWRVRYDEWEYCRILAGVSILTEDGGPARMLRAGDSFVIRPGFSGTWEVVETTTKDYVIRL
ncbi:MAG: cupin domain-containing protein [Rubellimicrobium sp.]|nr:cupin domain-containing protein [Rubellimicrobium sp.]